MKRSLSGVRSASPTRDSAGPVFGMSPELREEQAVQFPLCGAQELLAWILGAVVHAHVKVPPADSSPEKSLLHVRCRLPFPTVVYAEAGETQRPLDSLERR